MDKFLCCLELEVVGILLGWLTIIGFGIGYLYLGYVAVFCIILDEIYTHRWKFTLWNVISYIFRYNTFLCFYLFYTFAVALSGIYLLIGIKNRNHKKLRYFLALIAIGIFVTPIAVFSLQVSVPVQATITTIVVLSHIYAFMCILTLHRRIQNSDTYQQLA